MSLSKTMEWYRKRQAVASLKNELEASVNDEKAREALMLMVDASATLWFRYRGWKTAKVSKMQRKVLEAVSTVFPGIKSNDVTFMRLIMEHILLALDSVASGRQTPEEAWCRGLAARLMYDLSPNSEIPLKTLDAGPGKGAKMKIRIDNVAYHALGCPVEARNEDGEEFSSWWGKFCRTPLLDHGEAAEWGSAVSVLVRMRGSSERPEPDEWVELWSAMVGALRLDEIRGRIDARSIPRQLIDEYLSEHSADSEQEPAIEPDSCTEALLRAQRRLEDLRLARDAVEASTAASSTQSLTQ